MSDHIVPPIGQMVSASETAHRLHCTVQTVRRMAKAGELTTFRVHRRLFFLESEIAAMFAFTDKKGGA